MNNTEFTPFCSVVVKDFTPVPVCSFVHSFSPCRQTLLLQSFISPPTYTSVSVHPAFAEPALWLIFRAATVESKEIILCQRPKWVFEEFLVWHWPGRWACSCVYSMYVCVFVCVSSPLLPPSGPAPHNRKQRGEARVYGLIWPQRSLLFWNRAAALQAYFPYWSGMERFDPGTGAGKHDTGRSFEHRGDGRGAASARAHLPFWVRQKQVGRQCQPTAQPECSTCRTKA